MHISTLFRTSFILGGLMAISGCAPNNNPSTGAASTIVRPATPSVYSQQGLTLCQSEVQALKSYDWQGYQRHKDTFDSLTARSVKYLIIRPQLSENMQSVMDSIYQAQLARYCQQIHNDLFNAMIAHADAA